MKTKEEKKINSKEINSLETVREIKKQISEDLYGKSPEEIKLYLKKNSKKLHSKK